MLLDCFLCTELSSGSFVSSAASLTGETSESCFNPRRSSLSMLPPAWKPLSRWHDWTPQFKKKKRKGRGEVIGDLSPWKTNYAQLSRLSERAPWRLELRGNPKSSQISSEVPVWDGEQGNQVLWGWIMHTFAFIHVVLETSQPSAWGACHCSLGCSFCGLEASVPLLEGC